MNLNKDIIPRPLLKVLSFTAVSTLVKMVGGFLTIKIIATLIGAQGLVMLGQLNNFVVIMLILASGGIGNGIIKYVSENKDAPNALREHVKTAYTLTFIFSILSSIILILFSQHVSVMVLMREEYSYVFLTFAATLGFFSYNNLATSLANGLKDYRRSTFISIVNSTISLVSTFALVSLYGLPGLLLSVVCYQVASTLIIRVAQQEPPKVSFVNIFSGIDLHISRNYLKYSLMSLTTASTIPVTQLLIRGNLVQKVSIQEAGWWEAMNRLSSVYLAVLISALSVYYLPKLSELKRLPQIVREVEGTFLAIFPLMVVGFCGVFLIREKIIIILFSEEFKPMAEFFIWQLIGDLFKVGTWLISFVFVAKTYTKHYIATEVGFQVLYTILAYALIGKSGTVGAFQAYVFTYILSFITMVWLLKNITKREISSQ